MWMERFQASVRERDFETGLTLYSEKATMFGTRVSASTELNDYSQRQWRKIWTNSKDFRFEQITQMQSSGEFAFCSATWSNRTLVDGQLVERTGRATFVFQTLRGEIKAIHSHFSETPNLN